MLLSFLPAWPGGLISGASPGEQVAVIYNSEVAASKTLAQYYANRRRIPDSNLFGFQLPHQEEISRKTFESQLIGPLYRKLIANKLIQVDSESKTDRSMHSFPIPKIRPIVASELRYLVPCYGVPVKIRSEERLGTSKTNADLPSPLQRNEAAIDSELAALPLHGTTNQLQGPLSNPMYRTRKPARLSPTNGLFMVARLDGPDYETAKGLVDLAMEAERDGLWGRAYFDARGAQEANYKQGDKWIRRAADIARSVGYETVLDEAPETFPAGFPMSHTALYAGWYAPEIRGPFAEPGFHFMPGALAYHLHSFSAQSIRSPTKHWVGPLLAKGATATLGHVYEPYLELTPNIEILVHRFLTGFSFGEAAYAAQNALSWQSTVVGDPLYRPYLISAKARHRQLLRENHPRLEWSHLLVANRALAQGIAVKNVIDHLIQTPSVARVTRQSAVLLEKLGSLYHREGRNSKAAETFDRALDQAPSPTQALRLLELAATAWQDASEPEKAYARYQRITEDFPDYPDLKRIRQKMLELAKQIDKPAQIKKLRDRLDITPSRSTQN